ncbi:hypothetical protein Tco_0977352 [Tanacetum coccineum]|uniref:Uncharacterized protein n=1 Tax=Tanacetum coccineum TaxID=301880 RepID=A0ABQ5EJV3_9ASTR
MGLWYPKGSGFELTAFSNADHAGCVDTCKNTFRGIQFLGDKLVSWMSKKQDCTAMSSAEAEYVALSASCAHVIEQVAVRSGMDSKMAKLLSFKLDILDFGNLRIMPPKRTSTSETPAITLAAIRQLINDGISSALKAQAASMASASNPNKNTGTSKTPVARKGINDHKRKFEDR